MGYRETAYSTLKKINDIQDYEQRKHALRQELIQNNVLAIVVQRTYHPNYNFTLPVGPLPNEVAKKSNHNEAGPFYNSLKKWYIFRPENECVEAAGIKQTIKEAQFIDLYESVATDDADLLIGVKDKKLPFDNLSAEFVTEAIPELFPEGFQPVVREEVENIPVKTFPADTTMDTILKTQRELVAEYKLDYTTDPRSKKEICLDIMQRNPDLTRKEYLKLFEEVGVAKTTGALYYQTLKNKAVSV